MVGILCPWTYVTDRTAVMIFEFPPAVTIWTLDVGDLDANQHPKAINMVSCSHSQRLNNYLTPLQATLYLEWTSLDVIDPHALEYSQSYTLTKFANEYEKAQGIAAPTGVWRA